MRMLLSVFLLGVILVACKRDYAGHGQDARLYSIDRIMKDSASGHWRVLSHMEYAYDSAGRIQEKKFYLRDDESLNLALRYDYEYRHDTSMIETRLDCEGSVCKNDMRKILRINPESQDSSESIFGWNAQELKWELAWKMRHWFDSIAQTDTVLYTRVHGDFERRIVLRDGSTQRRIIQVADSSGNWLLTEWSECKWENNHPNYCKSGRKEGVTETEQWFEYDEQDSLRQIQTRKSGVLHLEFHHNDRHGHRLHGYLGENVEIERRYR